MRLLYATITLHLQCGTGPKYGAALRPMQMDRDIGTEKQGQRSFGALSLTAMAGRKNPARLSSVNALIWHHLDDQNVNMTDNIRSVNYG
ncbi:MAG: hypothetical protein JHD32_05795 [Sphingobium sp.]|nr:hypothetical protein [Sphingobium sp.]